MGFVSPRGSYSAIRLHTALKREDAADLGSLSRLTLLLAGLNQELSSPSLGNRSMHIAPEARPTTCHMTCVRARSREV